MDKRVKLFDKQPAIKLSQDVSFSGHGFIPDVMSDYSHSTFPAAVTNYPVEEGVLGRKAMMPASGLITPEQPHFLSAEEEGVGGAGSFLTASAFGARG